LKKPPEPVFLGDGCKSRLLFAKIAMAIRCQPRRWVQAPSLIEKETSEVLVSYKKIMEKRKEEIEETYIIAEETNK